MFYCCCSVAQLCLSLCNPMNCNVPGFPLLHYFPEPAQTQVHCVSDAIQPSHLLSPSSPPASIFPSIKILSNESVLYIRYPKYWSFSFSLSPSSEYSGLISFRMDWLDLTPQFKSISSWALSFLYNPTLTSIHNYWKNPSLD